MAKPSPNALSSFFSLAHFLKFLIASMIRTWTLGCKMFCYSFISFFQRQVKASPNSLSYFFSLLRLVQYLSSLFSFPRLFKYLFPYIILTCILRCEKFCYSFISFFQPQLEFSFSHILSPIATPQITIQIDKAIANVLSSFFSLPLLVQYLFLYIILIWCLRCDKYYYIILIWCLRCDEYYYIILTWSHRCEKFYYSFISFFQAQHKFFFVDLTIHSGRKNPTPETDSNQQSCFEKGGDAGLKRDDVEMVMERLGILCIPDGEKIKECLGSDDISALFQDDEPSLRELKEAFQVFDVGGDGFIDAREVQRVLGKLGFWEASNLDVCAMMIREFDENGDGCIDFEEFVKMMEKGFC